MSRDRKNLLNRLQILKEAGISAASGKSTDQSRKISSHFLSGWEKIGEYTFKKETVRDKILPEKIRCPFLFPSPVDRRNCIFFDTETTGLSGGAGTRFFLIGFGIPAQNNFCIRQYFLSDFPGEEEFLKTIRHEFSESKIFVSYNGKGFDSHLIRSRYALTGEPLCFPAQKDLLHTARRLWKSIIGSCSLSSVEEKILKIERPDDIPGYLIPDAYFRFLKTGETDEISGIFKHNETDIYSLTLLINVFEEYAEKPLTAESDKTQLGLLLLSSGRNDEGRKLLVKAFDDGSEKAGIMLGLFYKRAKKYSDAEKIWAALFKKMNNIAAGIELAKYYEHIVRNRKQAFRIVEECIKITADLAAEKRKRYIEKDLLKRRLRLENYLH